MNNNYRTIHASTCYCKAVPSIEVNSGKYNDDKAYQNKIDFMLDRAYLSK